MTNDPSQVPLPSHLLLNAGSHDGKIRKKEGEQIEFDLLPFSSSEADPM